MRSLHQAHHLSQSRNYKEKEECNAWGSPEDREVTTLFISIQTSPK